VKAHQSLLTTYLLTAHHADDNNETVLMNFFRGTGLHGLTGIPENAGYLRRPLLNFSKKELIEFAKENQLQFVEDSSNQSSKYTRNFFRNEILPTISKVYPQVSENLQDNIKRFKEIEQLYHFTVNELKKKICKQKANDTWIAVKELMNDKNNALIYEIIAAFDFTEKQIEEVIKLAESESGRYIQSPGGKYRMIKHRNWFIVSSVSTIQSENIIIEKEVESIAFAGGKLQITSLNNKPLESNSKIACLDAKGIEFPLLLRKWKAGDYFYPLGMAKKKKLSRFFIDQKLSKIEKENSWVIESKSRVIWIVGQRIDNRFKVTEKTANVLQFTLSA
jgi:tRNA(Ile)-lysidine synthase